MHVADKRKTKIVTYAMNFSNIVLIFYHIDNSYLFCGVYNIC